MGSGGPGRETARLRPSRLEWPLAGSIRVVDLVAKCLIFPRVIQKAEGLRGGEPQSLLKLDRSRVYLRCWLSGVNMNLQLCKSLLKILLSMSRYSLQRPTVG